LRRLIVNADDFGLSTGINRGIIECHERGVVTSASLMVRGPAAPEAAAYAREHPSLAVGLHVDLGEWAYQEDRWIPLYEVVATDNAVLVDAEIRRQLAAFEQLTGSTPTHLDSHQHVHRDGSLRSVFMQVARELGVTLRHCSREITYCGEFYGQMRGGIPLPEAITAEGLIAVLRLLRPGVTELACHPGYGADLATTMYKDERAVEITTLCDPRVRAALAQERIELCSFSDLLRASASAGATGSRP
jgi:predicted glycoside hydrolase/deacetylase ChbG (UPF0249 family)